jgi:hypothetical protein
MQDGHYHLGSEIINKVHDGSVLGYEAASIPNQIPTFRDNVVSSFLKGQAVQEE